MSEFALGLAALGRPTYVNVGRDGVHRSVDELRRLAHATLDAAWAVGIRRVDAARSYGRAEEFLASWLAAHPGRRRECAVSSKWGYRYTADWDPDADVHEVKEHTLEHLRAQWRETRETLGSPDLYQVHSLTTDSPLFDDEPLLAELGALRDGGVRLGFSTSGPDQADAVRRGLALQVDARPLFTAVQSTWNLLETSVGDALAHAHAAGASVLVKEGLANGRLVVDPPAPLAAVATAHGVGPDAVALAAIAAQPFVDVVLSGAADPAQLRSNLAPVALTAGDLDELGALARPADEYWTARRAMAWV